MIPYFQALFIQRHGMISALMIYGLENTGKTFFQYLVYYPGEIGVGKWNIQLFIEVTRLLCFFCLVFAMSLCASFYMCFVVTCWERADLLALVCGV